MKTNYLFITLFFYILTQALLAQTNKSDNNKSEGKNDYIIHPLYLRMDSYYMLRILPYKQMTNEQLAQLLLQ